MSRSVSEMYESDCLLVIDPFFNDPQKNIYVPGKIYDYISTGRPILCISDENSATGDIFKRINSNQENDIEKDEISKIASAIGKGLVLRSGYDAQLLNIENLVCDLDSRILQLRSMNK